MWAYLGHGDLRDFIIIGGNLFCTRVCVGVLS